MAALLRGRGRRRGHLRVALLGSPADLAAWADRLSAAGHLVTRGGPESVSATAEGADLVITVLDGDSAVRRAYTELARTAAPGQVFVDASPAAPATLEFCALALPAFLSAAWSADRSFNVRGEPAHYERARPVLEAIATAVRHAGPDAAHSG